MTARERIWARAVIGYGYFVLFLALLVVAGWLRWKPGAAGIALLMAAFCIPFPLLMLRARCVRCAFPFAQWGFWRLKHGAAHKRIDFCPHCRLPLDTPVAEVVPNPKS